MEDRHFECVPMRLYPGDIQRPGKYDLMPHGLLVKQSFISIKFILSFSHTVLVNPGLLSDLYPAPSATPEATRRTMAAQDIHHNEIYCIQTKPDREIQRDVDFKSELHVYLKNRKHLRLPHSIPRSPPTLHRRMLLRKPRIVNLAHIILSIKIRKIQ